MKKHLLFILTFYLAFSICIYLLIYDVTGLEFIPFALVVLALHVIFLLIVVFILNKQRRAGRYY